MLSRRHSVICHARSSLCRGAALARPVSLSGYERIPKSASLPCPYLVSIPSFALLQDKRKNTPLFSSSYALFKKSVSVNSFTISSFRTLLQNTGGVHASYQESDSNPSASSLLSSLESALAKNAPITPLLSAPAKTQDLKPFRIITYEKRWRGGLTVNQTSDDRRSRPCWN